MSTVNISLPTQLRFQADLLVEKGHFSSFSDLVRTAVRNLIHDSQYDLWTKEAKLDLKKKKAKILTGEQDITKYLEGVQKE